ncbi:MAG: hypothetical protein AAF655_20255 [Bacteroidota bacterium]
MQSIYYPQPIGHFMFHPYVKLMQKYWLVILLFSVSIPTFSQVVVPPSEGKAVVYFVQPSFVGSLDSYRIFDRDNLIGFIWGKNYLRYECEPGERLLWASCENRFFLEASLEANKIYLVEVDTSPGILAVRLHLRLVTDGDEQIGKIMKLLAKKEEKIHSPEEIAKWQDRWERFINRGLARYEKLKGEGSPTINRLEKEDFIQLEG